MNRINLFLLLFSIVITDNIFAQVFTNYTSEPSTTLLENQISSIAIDSLGNKWFGTMAGASKFDGINWVHNSMNLP